jgi:hypothetical protein
MWGLWDLTIAEEFRRAMFNCARDLEGASWGILADSREYAAQTAAVSEIRSQMMPRLLLMGCMRIGAVVNDAGTYAMQFNRITGQSHMTSEVFRDDDIALAWVSEHRSGL